MKTNEAPEKIYLEFYRVGDKKYREWVITPKTNDEPIQYIRKDALVKYLYEEKGYPITLNGELVHWNELNKHLAEYIKLKKDAFIEKALKFLDGCIPDYIELKHANVDTFMDVDNERFIKDFINYIKGK